MANPPQGRNKSKEGASSNKKQLKRSFEDSEIGRGVRPDDTTNAEKRPCFAQSADKHILDKQPGFGEVKPTKEDHQGNRGLDTLSSDSRKAPLPEQGVKQPLDWKRNNENIVYGDEEMTVS